MKKLLFSIICMTTMIAHAQNWVNLGSSDPTEVTVSVISNNSQTINLRAVTSGFNVTDVSENGVVFQRIGLPRAEFIGDEGSPELPIIHQMVAIPDCSGVSINTRVVSERTLNNYHVYPVPAQQAVMNADSTWFVQEVFCMNNTCYNANAFQPTSNVSITEVGQMRNQKYVNLEIAPIRYNPSSNSLNVATELEITIELNNANGQATANVGVFDNVVSHTMINHTPSGMTAEINDMRFGHGNVSWEPLENEASAGQIVADYLIICADQYYEPNNPDSEILRLAQHRANYNGYDVAIVNVNRVLELNFCHEGNDDYEIWGRNIRSFIQAVYDGCHANHTYDGHLGFVLLVGKPTYYSPTNPSQNNICNVPSFYDQRYQGLYNNNPIPTPCDYLFACVTQENEEYDDVADLFVGRFCVNKPDKSDLHNIVENTIYKEKNFNPIINNVLDAANGLRIEGQYNHGFFENTFYPYLQQLIGNHKTLVRANAEILGEEYSTALKEMLDAGAPLFIMHNHGGPTYWENGFGISQIENSNTMTQFCVSFSCLTGYIDYNIPCLAQNSTTLDNHRGFVGFLGAGRSIYFGCNLSDLTCLVPEAIYNHLSHITGEFILESLLSCRTRRHQFNLIGDPALNLFAKGYEVTNQITLDDTTYISHTVTVKNDGRIIAPQNSKIYIGSNAGIIVEPSGRLIVHNGTHIEGVQGQNSFLTIKGNNNGILNPGTSLTNINIKLLNPAMQEHYYQNMSGCTLFNSPILAKAISLGITGCDFNNRSDIKTFASCVTVSNSEFDQSGLATLGTLGTESIPHGAILPTIKTDVSNCNFSNCGSFEIYERCISDAAIYMANIANYRISRNNIENCISGLNLKNSGSSVTHKVTENDITYCSKDGIVVYNSFVDFKMNNISDNNGRGISIFNNSQTTCYENIEPTNGYQFIGRNASNQIYSSNTAFPAPFRYNKIAGNAAGRPCWIHHETLLASNNARCIDVKMNNWDNNVNFIPARVFNNPSLFCWDPFWNMAKAKQELEDDESMFVQAIQYYEDSSFLLAKQMFEQIINEHPESPFAVSALKELFSIEQYIDNDYTNLKNYYQHNEIIHEDTILNKVADFLSTQCEIKNNRFQEALNWYAIQLSNDSLSYQDSVFYIIDIGDIYLSMENDSTNKESLHEWYLANSDILPKSLSYHDQNTKYLLSTLPLTKSIAENEDEKPFNNNSFVSLYPNPTNGIITIEANEMRHITVFNTLGQVVFDTEVDGDRKLLNMEQYGTGVFFIRIETANSSFSRIVNVTK